MTVTDPYGEQVADLLAFRRDDLDEVISSGRSLDYAGCLCLTTGAETYSNRSNVLLRIVEDTVGRHDFLLTPCSEDAFRIIYGDEHPHHGCFGNLSVALAPFGIHPDRIPVAFNIFMNVVANAETGVLRVDPPLSRAGDHITFLAEVDLIIGLTACSALQSNNYAFKPIDFSIGASIVHPAQAVGHELGWIDRWCRVIFFQARPLCHSFPCIEAKRKGATRDCQDHPPMAHSNSRRCSLTIGISAEIAMQTYGRTSTFLDNSFKNRAPECPARITFE